MGNVHAASNTTTSVPCPPIQPVSPPSPPPPKVSSILVPVENVNPGTFEDLHRQCKDIFPQIFEGGKLIVSKGLSGHFQISHTVSLATFQPSGYRFGCTFVGSKQFSNQEAFPVLIGDIDASGNLNANIIHAFSERLRTKVVAQIQNNKCVASQCSTDYKGSDFTATFTAGNIDPINDAGLLVAQYLQTINPRLAFGSELLFQYGPQLPGGEIAILSLAGRYSGDKWQLSANVSPLAGSFHACYYHKISDQLSFGAELETSLRLQESNVTIGYQVEIPNANTTFKAQFDTNWCLGAVMEKKLQPFPFTFALSGWANHVKGQLEKALTQLTQNGRHCYKR